VRAARPVVQAVNYPLAYFARRIAGDLLDVRLLAPAGRDPASWQPSDEAIEAFQAADLILLNGAQYARWTLTAPLPRSRCVVSTRGFTKRLIQQPSVTHSHGPGGAHTHGHLAYTTWLDFEQAQSQAEVLAEAFAGLLPDQKARLEAGLGSLKRDLAALDAALRALGTPLTQPPLLASHPVYKYLARRYDLKLKSVHWEPSEAPPESEWIKLGALLKVHPAQVMLWESEPLPETRRRLEALGLRLTVFDPCPGRPKTGDFLSVMGENIKHLGATLTN